MTHPLPHLLRALLLPLLLLAGTAHAELASHTSFKGEVTAYTYDVMGREVTRTFADGQQVRTTYTPTGQVASVTDARGTTTYAYDARDRVIRIDYPDGQWLAYAWDGNGNRTALTTPTGTTTYAYDDGNRLVQVTDPAGAVTTYAWDEAGNPTGQVLPNGVSTFRAYDDNGQLEAVRHEKDGVVLARYTYTRDEDGRRVGAVEEQLDPATSALHSSTLAWSYDELGRLASETLTESGHTTTTAWTHDEVGNRLSEARFREGVLLATDRYAYDANDRLTRAWTENGAGGTVSETLYTYDANGATTEVVRTGGASRTYAYDAAQRLVAVSDSTGQRITYGYDAQGNRVTQSVQSAPDLALNGSWRYLLDPLAPFAEVVATLTDAGQAETDYRFGAGRIAELTAGQLLYYGEDGHHSVRLVTDAQGQVVAHLNYAAFGQAAGSVTDDASGNPAVSPTFRYTGQQWDGALGEYYLRARTYDPAVGRFTQRDSWQGNLQRPVTLNAYLYADANPISGWDPSGHSNLQEKMVALGVQFQTFAYFNPLTTSIGSVGVGVAFSPWLPPMPMSPSSGIEILGSLGKLAYAEAQIAKVGIAKFLGGRTFEDWAIHQFKLLRNTNCYMSGAQVTSGRPRGCRIPDAFTKAGRELVEVKTSAGAMVKEQFQEFIRIARTNGVSINYMFLHKPSQAEVARMEQWASEVLGRNELIMMRISYILER